jgi:hypothetical protein
MSRRDAFSLIRAVPTTEQIDVDPSKQMDSASSPIDLIPVASQRRKQSRKWEQAHRAETVTYRGVPKDCQLWIEEIANSLQVPRDEVVRACLEFGLASVESGEVHLIAFPRSQRMTLFPDGGRKGAPEKRSTGVEKNWLKDVFPTPTGNHKNTRKQAKNTVLWQQRVTYRIPLGLKEKIRLLAFENFLPIGEIVWYFIDMARKASLAGNLHFDPVPRNMGRTLFQNPGN